MIDIIKIKDKVEGNLKAYDILRDIVDSQTLLALSGGTSPDYKKMIVEPADIVPGAVCLVDERFGNQIHKDSNEQKLINEGVLDYCKSKRIEFHNILWHGDLQSDVCVYDELIASLLAKYPKKVGVMGVGTNLHTAGIFPNSNAINAEDFVVGEEVDDKFPQRITMTFKALGEFTNFVILVFGEEKREVLKILLDENENDIQKYPAIFYRKCLGKSYLITDCDI